MPKLTGGPDTESQNRRKDSLGSNEPISPKRRMLLKDVPSAIREDEGRNVMELPDWLATQVLSAIQRLKQGIREQGNIIDNFQILAEAIGRWENELAAVAKPGWKIPPIYAQMKRSGGERAESGSSS